MPIPTMQPRPAGQLLRQLSSIRARHRGIVASRVAARSRGPHRERSVVARAEANDSASEGHAMLENKLNLPPDALQYIARGWAQNSRSDVPVDLLSAVADLPMTDGEHPPLICARVAYV